MKKNKKVLIIIVLFAIILLNKTTFAIDNETSSQNNNSIQNNSTNQESIETSVDNIPASVQEPKQPTVNPISEPVQEEKVIETTQKNNNNTKTKSTNNYLKSITLDEDGITPEFDKNTDEYYIIVPLRVNYIDIEAVPEDSKSKISVIGNKNLKEGENTITITVTAESGNWRVYKINVSKTDDEILANANLKELKIEGFEIDFEPNTYKYKIEVDEKQYNLNVTASTENEKATMTIEGNENLQNGENKITIKVIAEDGITQKEYIIYAVKDFAKVQIDKTNNQVKFIITGICTTLFLICLVMLIYRLKKRG